jgi:hypothetical protein
LLREGTGAGESREGSIIGVAAPGAKPLFEAIKLPFALIPLEIDRLDRGRDSGEPREPRVGLIAMDPRGPWGACAGEKGVPGTVAPERAEERPWVREDVKPWIGTTLNTSSWMKAAMFADAEAPQRVFKCDTAAGTRVRR